MMKNHISVCVCTLHRPVLLRRLLNALELQVTDEWFDYSVVVVDNDIEGSARSVVDECMGLGRLEVRYGVEPEQSIPAARNHAVRLAGGDMIAFIDDDEFPIQEWLLRLYRSLQLFGSEGVLGPVVPYFDEVPPVWLAKSGLCERPFPRSGTVLNWEDTRTGNVLLRRSVFDDLGVWFDRQYKTSGSDKEFFREAMASGCRFVSADDAIVYEVVPVKRQTRAYYLRRALIQASNERRYRTPFLHGTAKVTKPLKAIVAVGIYLAVLPVCALGGSHYVMRYLEKLTYHFSWLLAMFGVDLAKTRNL